jgi:hypothetical protein
MYPAYIHQQCIITYTGPGGERNSSPSLILPGNTHVMYLICQVLLDIVLLVGMSGDRSDGMGSSEHLCGAMYLDIVVYID